MNGYESAFASTSLGFFGVGLLSVIGFIALTV